MNGEGWLRHIGVLAGLCAVLSSLVISVAATPTQAARPGDRASHAGAAGKHTIPHRCPRRNVAHGTLRVYSPGLVSNNPYKTIFATGGPVDQLFDYDDHLRLYPILASRVPTVQNGDIRDRGKTIIIHLKQGLRWSNGTEITSVDVRFGWQIAMDPASDTGFGTYCFTTCDVISSIGTPDRYTAVLHLKQVRSSLLSDLGLPFPWPQQWPGAWKDDPHAAALKLFQDPTFDFLGPQYPNDTAYVVESYQPGKMLRLRPMKYYSTMNCGAYIKHIVTDIQPFPSDAAELAQYIAHPWDISVPTTQVLPELRKRTKLINVRIVPSLGLEHIEFNVSSSYLGAPNPLHDTRVRQALALALPRTPMVRIGFQTPISQRTAEDNRAWTPWMNTAQYQEPSADRSIVGQWDPLAHRYLAGTGQGEALRDARTLMRQTHWKKGFTLEGYGAPNATVPTRAQELEAAKAAWKKVGVTLNVHIVPGRPNLFGSWNEGGILAHGAFQMAVFTSVTAPGHDDFRTAMESRYVPWHMSSHDGGNYTGLTDPIIDRAWEAAGGTLDRAVQHRNYRIIQQRLNQQAYWIPLYWVPRIFVTSKRVANVTWNPLSGCCWNPYAWKLKGR